MVQFLKGLYIGGLALRGDEGALRMPWVNGALELVSAIIKTGEKEWILTFGELGFG